MSTATLTLEERLAKEAVDTALELLKADNKDRVRSVFRHEDGSITAVIYQEYDQEYADPRDHDGNVSHLIDTGRDYVALDTDEVGIDEARKRFDHYDLSEVGIRRNYPGADGSYWGARLLLGGRSSHRADYMVRRWLSIYRPEVVHYDDWSVHGSSQGSWRSGYGYVLAEDVERTGITVTAKEAFDEEVRVYQLYFEGSVFEACNLSLGDPEITYGAEGAYISGYVVDEDWCGGFLAFAKDSEIATQMSTSPVSEEITA